MAGLAGITLSQTSLIPSTWPSLTTTQVRITKDANGKVDRLWAKFDVDQTTYCYYFKVDEADKLAEEWESIPIAAARIMAAGGIAPLTDADKAICQGLDIPWAVQQYKSYPDRPMYDGVKFEACMANVNIVNKLECTKAPHWVGVGRVAFATPCEDQTIRDLSSNLEYHYTTNSDNVRGLAVCQRGVVN